MAVITAEAASAEAEPTRHKELLYLLKHDCGSCHGITLRGGLGPPLTKEALAGKSTGLLADIITYGLPGTAMPPWLGLLSREEILWLAKRIQKGSSSK
ncbi:MAG: cytochrome c [Magnetococcales bacterium]|nr:cytochrome c [Magnetococcales bacterium]